MFHFSSVVQFIEVLNADLNGLDFELCLKNTYEPKDMVEEQEPWYVHTSIPSYIINCLAVIFNYPN